MGNNEGVALFCREANCLPSGRNSGKSARIVRAWKLQVEGFAIASAASLKPFCERSCCRWHGKRQNTPRHPIPTRKSRRFLAQLWKEFSFPTRPAERTTLPPE